MILIRYAEIHLKGLNRPYFEQALMRNIKTSIKPFPGAQIERRDGRFYVEGYDEADEARIIERLRKVFGIHSVSLVRCCEKNLDAIYALCVDVAREATRGQELTFKVRARRSDKRFELDSMALACEIGHEVLSALPELKVDVHTPDIMLDVEVREQVYVYTNAISGAGGMPVGTGGRALLLLSGGIDSPVAGNMIAKRGVVVNSVHFESVPYTSAQAKQKVVDLARIMGEYTGPMKLWVVNFTPIQQKLYQDCEKSLLTILMRRFMMRISETIARQNKCTALVTGESLGQVASQTMEGLQATNAVVNMPVFRPLIGFDKLEIMDRARVIGTYETSILPYEDCCSVFVPKRPATKPKLDFVEKSEAELDIAGMVESAATSAEVIKL